MKEVKDNTLTAAELVELAGQHGLRLQPETFHYNETGLDFQVIQALDEKQQSWILRLPRRADVLPRANNEHRVLRMLRGKLPADLPAGRFSTRS